MNRLNSMPFSIQLLVLINEYVTEVPLVSGQLKVKHLCYPSVWNICEPCSELRL